MVSYRMCLIWYHLLASKIGVAMGMFFAFEIPVIMALSLLLLEQLQKEKVMNGWTKFILLLIGAIILGISIVLAIYLITGGQYP